MRLLLPVAAALAATALVGWNASRFIGAESRIRTKELDFLPSPLAARMTACGHANTLAKLRWIDSFAYFQLVLDRKDDRISATGESAFERLYAMLIGMDPHFTEYHNSAALNLGAILDRSHRLLAILTQGLVDNPHDTSLWRQLAVLMYTQYKMEERHSVQFNALLDDWAAHELTEERKQQVWDWKASFGRRTYQGLEQVPYWLEQLRHAKAGTPTHDFVLGTLREQLARWGEQELKALGAQPGPDGLLTVTAAAVAQRWPGGIPGVAPVRATGDGVAVREDPFGFAYTWVDDAPFSPGRAYRRAQGMAAHLSGELAAKAVSAKTWATTIDELRATGVTIPPPPAGASWRIEGQRVVLTTPSVVAKPWTF